MRVHGWLAHALDNNLVCTQWPSSTSWPLDATGEGSFFSCSESTLLQAPECLCCLHVYSMYYTEIISWVKDAMSTFVQ